MMRDIFLPTRLGSSYLFSQKIVALEVTAESIRATMVYAHRSKSTVLAYTEEFCDPSSPESLREALEKIKLKVGKWDEVIIVLPSSKAVFKHMQLPFSNKGKLRLILPFELESILPFPIEDATFDLLINSVDTKIQNCDFMVAAMRKLTLDTYIQPFISAGITPSRITLSSIELFGFLATVNQSLPEESTVLLNSDQHHTEIILIVNKSLHAVRVIPMGIDSSLAQQSMQDLQAEQKDYLKKLFAEINFTIQSLVKSERVPFPTTFFLTGNSSPMNGLLEFCQERLRGSCILINPRLAMHQKRIDMRLEGVLPPSCTTTLAAALPWSKTESFNIGASYKEQSEIELLRKQILISGILAFLIFGSFIIFNFLSSQQLRKELHASQEEVATILKKEFQSIPRENISDMISEAKNKLALSEGVWAALTSDRYAFVHYLQKLSTNLDREKLGLDIKRLVMKKSERGSEDRIIIQASVKDFNALKTFETALIDTNLFTKIKRPQNTNFELSLPVNKTKGGGR